MQKQGATPLRAGPGRISNIFTRFFQQLLEGIQVVVVPHHFREPIMTSYDGSGDLHNHVSAFQTTMLISGGDDVASCNMFTGTLKDVALCWFIGLPPRSIANFEDFSQQIFRSVLDQPRKKLLYLTCLTFIKVAMSHSRSF